LVAHHLLNRSATDPITADHQPPLGKRSIAETLAARVAPACMCRPARKKGRALSDLNRMAAYRFGAVGSRQAAGRGPAWLSPAAPARLFFFSLIALLICKSLQGLKFNKN
jgi:hypothetical protein